MMNRENTQSASPDLPAAQRLALNEVREAREATRIAVLTDTHPLHGVKTQLEVRLGKAQVSLGDLMGVSQKSVLVLDTALTDPVDLTLNGKVIARGELIAVDGKFAVRIQEIPTPLTLPTRS